MRGQRLENRAGYDERGGAGGKSKLIKGRLIAYMCSGGYKGA